MDSDGDDDHRGKEEREMVEVHKKWRRGGIGAVGPPDCKECKGGKNKRQEDEDLQHLAAIIVKICALALKFVKVCKAKYS